MHSTKRVVLLVALIGVLAPVHATLAQMLSGSIFVRVTDPHGAALPGATVTLSGDVLIGGDRTGLTGSDGAFRYPGLPPGRYTVLVELESFRSQRTEDVNVSVSATTSIDVSLSLEDIEEVLTVVGRAPTVDTSNTTVSTLISPELLQDTPGAHDLWSLLEYKVPALVSSRPDVGGQESGLQAGFVAKGTPHGQNTQALNGVNVSDPEAIGFADFYYDYDSFEEVQVSTASHSVEIGTPGVYVNMVTKRGGDRFSGAVAGYFQNDDTQSDNVDQELRDKGIRQAGFDYLSDGGVQVGGPLGAEKLRFFASVRDWRVHRFVNGFVDENGQPVVEPTDMFSWLVNLTYQPAANHQFGFFATTQTYDKPQRGASGLNTPLSNWKEDDHFEIYQASWNGVLGASTFADARVSLVDIFFPLFIKEEAKARGLQSTLELSTGVRTGSNNLEFIFERNRFQANGAISHFKDDWGGMRHEFRLGLDVSHSPNEFETSAIDQVNLRTSGGEPFSVTLYNTTLDSKRGVDTAAVFVSDSMKLKNWTITPGLRFETTEAYLPAQSSPPSIWFPEAQRQFDRFDNVVDWTNVAPRLGAIWNVRGNGKAALKLALGRYYYQVSAGLPDNVNPNGLSGETFLWNDLNGDLLFEAGEAGESLGAFGGLVTSMDPGIDQPYSDELVASFDYELFTNFRLSAGVTYRREKNLIGVRNTAAIWIPTQVVDPETGNTLTVFNQDASTLGQNRFLITNSDSLDILYRGLELVAEKRYSKRWQMLTSYTYSKGEQDQIADTFGTGVPSVDPNNQVNASGPTFWDRTHVFKSSAMVSLPHGVQLSGNVRFQTGQPFSRQIVVSGLNQGAIVVNAEPRGSRRYPSITTIDLRVAKRFAVSDRMTFELMLDGYNLTNENTATSLVERSGPRFEFPLSILGPRIFRLGAKLTF